VPLKSNQIDQSDPPLLKPPSQEPQTQDGEGSFFIQEVEGVTELHYKDDEGRVVRLTNKGQPVGGGGSINGDWQLKFRTITTTEFNNKQFTMSPVPQVASEVSVDILGGSSLVFGTDYTIDINGVFSWDGLGIDGIVQAGDVFRLGYFS